MKVTKQFVIGLLLAAEVKTHRLISKTHRNEFDSEWSDTMAAATIADEGEMKEQTLQSLRSEPIVQQVGMVKNAKFVNPLKMSDVVAVQTSTDLSVDKKLEQDDDVKILSQLRGAPVW